MEPRTLHLFPNSERENSIKRKIGRAALRSILVIFFVQCFSISYAQQWSQFPFKSCCITLNLKKWNNKLVILSGVFPVDTLVISPLFTWDGNNVDFIPNLRGDNGIQCLEVLNDTVLLVGGDFNKFENPYTLQTIVQARKIASYNGSSFSPVLPFNYVPDRAVKAIKYKEDIYIGGVSYFNYGTPGQKVVNNVARWDGNEIHDCDSGLLGGFGNFEAFAIYNNELIAAGDFGISRNGWAMAIASWDGQHWHDLDTGFVDGWVTSLTVDTHNNWLYAGGQIGYAGGFDGINVCNLARWDGQQWHNVGENCSSTAILYNGITDIEMYHGELYAAGYSFSGTPQDTLIMKWNGQQWKPIMGLNETVFDMEVYNDELVVAGLFTLAGNDSCHGLARWYSPPDTTLAANRPLIEKTQWLWPPQPNPNSGKVLIPYQNPLGKTSIIQITNTEGKLLKEITCFSGKNYLELNTTQYPKGIYHITMITDGWKKQSQKMVVD